MNTNQNNEPTTPEQTEIRLPGWENDPPHMALLGMAKMASLLEEQGISIKQYVSDFKEAVSPGFTVEQERRTMEVALEAAVRLARAFRKLRTDKNVSPEQFIEEVNKLVMAGTDNLIDLMNQVVALHGEPADRKVAYAELSKAKP